jgi:FKBP-type peptidyl-prolyl cis-trans isomerase FkpA
MNRKHISSAAAGGAMLAVLAWPALAAEPAKPNSPAPGTVATVTVPVEAELKLATDEQKTLYALGLALAQNLIRLDLRESELAYIVKGMQDAALKRPAQVSLTEYGPKLQELGKQRFAAAAEREQAAAKAYLAKRASEAGAVRTDSGMVVLSRQEGTGPSPTRTDTVRVNYEGTLPDGTVFDSSIQRGQPASFALDSVIPCWTEIVQTMKVGGRVKVICPPELAYGAEGRQGIPPNSPLTFDIHLLGIGEATASPGREGEVERDPLDQQVG